jgi:hypothetical protein
MAEQVTVSRPAPFVEKIGSDLATQAVALTGVPVVTGGLGSLTRAAGETDAGFKARQDAARAFEVRQQNLAGLAPQVADQDRLQKEAQRRAEAGLGSFQPFLDQAQIASAASFSPQIAQQFMSPYQQQVIDTSLAEFDRQAQTQEQRIRDQAVASGAFGGGREGVLQSEFRTGSDRNRLALEAGLRQQGFQAAQQAAQQNFANQMGLASALPGLQRGDISTLGSLGALNQAQEQARLNAQREATRMATFQPQEQLQNYGNLVTGIMGGMQGSGTTTQQIPDPTFLQTALGAAATGAGIYGALKRP